MSTVITHLEAKSNLAANLKRLLADRGWSQTDLADRSGENKMQISRIIRGLHVPDVACVANIAEALDVSIDRLLDAPQKISHAS